MEQQPLAKPDSIHAGAHMPETGTTPVALLWRYFSSGWTFLIPYFAAYILYARMGWPLSGNMAETQVLPLLSLYGWLHGLNILLAVAAVASWWILRINSPHSAIGNILPWIGFSILILIPGFYLEFPADPGEHLRRIHVWANAVSMEQLPFANRSSYALAQSLTGASFSSPYPWTLTIYYLGISLLLLWQYFRLAVSLGLARHGALLFCLLLILFMGNSSFSFHRYYGLSSTMFAQLAAVGMIRVAWEFLKYGQPRLRPWPSVGLACAWVTLACLAYVNHMQGPVIGAVGTTAVLLWWLAKFHTKFFWGAILMFIVANAGVVWMMDRISYPQEWITTYGAFSVLSVGSPAWVKVMEVAGFSGLAGAAIGLGMLFRNHPIGWMSVLPYAFLLFPGLATPMAIALEATGEQKIVAFARILFASPGLLAIAWLATSGTATDKLSWRWSIGVSVCMLWAVLASPGQPVYNRGWHAISPSPSELPRGELHADARAMALLMQELSSARIMTNELTGHLLWASGVDRVWGTRWLHFPRQMYPGTRAQAVLDRIHAERGHSNLIVVLVPETSIRGFHSLAAAHSLHWPRTIPPLMTVGQSEWRLALVENGFQREDNFVYFEVWTNRKAVDE